MSSHQIPNIQVPQSWTSQPPVMLNSTKGTRFGLKIASIRFFEQKARGSISKRRSVEVVGTKAQSAEKKSKYEMNKWDAAN